MRRRAEAAVATISPGMAEVGVAEGLRRLTAAQAFVIAVAVYYALHVVLRSALPRGAGRDSAEWLVATQVWAWGYGPQAPRLAWESQRAHSNTVMAVAATVWTLVAFLMICEHRRVQDYAAFGAPSALAALSKYNGAILPVALVLAALSLLVIPVHDRFGGLGKAPFSSADHAELLAKLEAQTGTVATKLAESHAMAGRFRLIRPSLVMLTPEYPLPELGELPTPVALFWRIEEAGELPPEALLALARNRTGAEKSEGAVSPPVTVAWPWPFEGGYSARGLVWIQGENVAR